MDVSLLKGLKKLKNCFVIVIREDGNISNVSRGTLDGIYLGASVSLNYMQSPRFSIVLGEKRFDHNKNYQHQEKKDILAEISHRFSIQIAILGD